MGLKTTDYLVKKFGITIPNVYAVVNKLSVDGDNAIAEFHVQTNRQRAFDEEPIETVIVPFKINRAGNLFAQAYEVAKGVKQERVWDATLSKINLIDTPMPFYGWEDDIENLPIEENGENIEEPTAINGDDYVETVFQNS